MTCPVFAGFTKKGLIISIHFKRVPPEQAKQAGDDIQGYTRQVFRSGIQGRGAFCRLAYRFFTKAPHHSDPVMAAQAKYFY
jgi:hypothetical protein